MHGLWATVPGFQENVKEIFNTLIKHVPDIKLVDDHPQCTVNSVVSDAFDKMMKASNRAIKKADLKRLRIDINEKIQPVYGKYANVHDIKVTTKGLKFILNFTSVYKTPVGRLYGMKIFKEDEYTLFTTHALERFEQRTDFKLLKILHGHDLSALDITKAVVFDHVDMENGKSILMTKYGYFVVDNITDKIFIVKTFMTFDMETEFSELANEYHQAIKRKFVISSKRLRM